METAFAWGVYGVAGICKDVIPVMEVGIGVALNTSLEVGKCVTSGNVEGVGSTKALRKKWKQGVILQYSQNYNNYT